MSRSETTKITPLDSYLKHKAKKDDKIYDYYVTPEGPTGLQLNVYRQDGVSTRSPMFQAPMSSERTMRTSDLFFVKSNNATYSLEFFM